MAAEEAGAGGAGGHPPVADGADTPPEGAIWHIKTIPLGENGVFIKIQLAGGGFINTTLATLDSQRLIEDFLANEQADVHNEGSGFKLAIEPDHVVASIFVADSGVEVGFGMEAVGCGSRLIEALSAVVGTLEDGG